MHSAKPIIFAALLLIAGITGCAHPAGQVSPAHPAILGKPASLDTILVATTSDLPDVDREKTVFSDQVVSDLRETELFANVNASMTNPASVAGIKLVIKITALQPVTDNARVWFGGLAGCARIAAQVTVSDLTTGKPVANFAVEGSSGSSARAGTTDAAIQSAAEQITLQMVRLNSETAEPLY